MLFEHKNTLIQDLGLKSLEYKANLCVKMSHILIHVLTDLTFYI